MKLHVGAGAMGSRLVNAPSQVMKCSSMDGKTAVDAIQRRD